MKFGKEFSSQMVPEWHEAYLNYNFLKKLVKDIKDNKKHTKHAEHPKHHELEFDVLSKRHTNYKAFDELSHQDKPENPVIRVNSVRRGGSEASETTFLKLGDEGGEYELMYFRRLDDEFFKVSKFYQQKVGEVVQEAEVLNKQMNALIAFRYRVEHPEKWTNTEMVKLASDAEASSAALDAKANSLAKPSRNEENSRSMRNSGKFSDDGGEEIKPIDDIETGKGLPPVRTSLNQENGLSSSSKPKRPAHLEILKSVKFNNESVTPRSMIKGFLNMPEEEMDFSREKLMKAEEQLSVAFVEFYQKLRLLKNYCFLNILAISKIMKKYDKAASRSAAKSYVKMVDTSFLGTSDDVNRLMERVEATFIKHFSNSNRSKGMKILRPVAKKKRHSTTFMTGFLVGCALSLILALCLIIRAHHILDSSGRIVYMETMFPLYSFFGFIVLHLVMYAFNIYFWRRYRVNYTFIFGFKQGTEIAYREVLLVSFCIGVLALASVLANLDMEMDPVTLDYQAITELLPLALLLSMVGILLCPFNIIFRSSRFFFLKTLYRCVLAPLYKVTLPDFMLADQLTSQVQAMRSLLFYMCYYIDGDYKHRQNRCSSNNLFTSFQFIVAVVPYWWRLVQCLRRWCEEKDVMQAYNGFKYFLTILAVCSRTAYSLNGDPNWQFIAFVTSIGATVHNTYWDICVDWGFLQPNSKNRWLRDKLLVPYKSVYFTAIGLNLVLRLAWMQNVMKLVVFDLHRQTLIVLVASLEIIRRGIWNFFRLENEHLNNVGKYRAFKSVPLPFNYNDDDDDKDD